MKKLIITAVFLTINAAAFSQSGKASLSSTNHTSVNITSTDLDYSLIANFQEESAAEIKKALVKDLGAPTENKDDLFIWLNKNAYTVTLRAEKLIIDLNKKNAGQATIKKFKKLGDRIRVLVSNEQEL